MFAAINVSSFAAASRALSTAARASSKVMFKFAPNHTYVAYTEDSDVVSVGLTATGVAQYTPISYVALPEPEAQVEAGEDIVSLECALSANEGVGCPVSGHVLAPNFDLFKDVGALSADPLGAGKLAQMRMTQPDQLDSLMDEDEYDAMA